jgi:hypothetical protein
MAKRRIRAKVTVEKDRILIVRSAQTPVLQWCPQCQREAGMVIPEEAARRRGVNARTIYRWIDKGIVHILELAGGDVLVCLNSIEKGDLK